MLTHDCFQGYIQQLEAVLKDLFNNLENKIISSEVEPSIAELIAAKKYTLLNGGKRIRALLVYSVAELLGCKSLIVSRAAAAVEMMHAFSLIHDDLPAMDNDYIRRGKAACHIKFNEATAILAGDALQTIAFEFLSDPGIFPAMAEQQLQMVNILAKASGSRGMAGGQYLDIAYLHDKNLTQEQLSNIHKLKTGKLIEASVALGYLAAQLDDTKHRQALDEYAWNIGIAFQIQDDILEVTQNTEKLGKSAKSDEKNNKQTYPKLIGLEQSQHLVNKHYAKAIQQLDLLPNNTDNLKRLARYIVVRDY